MHLQHFIKIHQLVHKILSINQISISIKGHNSVKNERNILFNHPKSTFCQYQSIYNLIEIHKLIHKIFEHEKILTSIKGHNAVQNRQNKEHLQSQTTPPWYQCPRKVWRKSVKIYSNRMWDLIVSVPDHCLSFYFTQIRVRKRSSDGRTNGHSNGSEGIT